MTLEENINLALKFMDSDNIKNFSRFYKLYSFSDENLTELFTRELVENKKILVTGSSADQIITAQLYNPDAITHFDINPFVYHMYNLKLAAIKELNLGEFINFFYDSLDNFMSIDKDTYNRIRNSIEDNSLVFWDTIFNNYSSNTIRESLFMINSSNKQRLKETLPYLSHNNFMKLKYRNLSSVDFIECNVFNLVDNIKYRYDMIYFSNIFNKFEMQDFYNKHYLKKLNEFMKGILMYTNENGKIILNYFYNTSKEDFKEKKYKYVDYPIHIFNVEDNISYLEVKSSDVCRKDTALVYTKKI